MLLENSFLQKAFFVFMTDVEYFEHRNLFLQSNTKCFTNLYKYYSFAASNNEPERLIMLHKIPDYSKPRKGPGEMGSGVYLEGKEAVLAQDQMKFWFMNVIARFVS